MFVIHIVKCLYCGIAFDRDKEKCAKIGNRYAHDFCFKRHENEKSKNEEDREKLNEYIKHLFNVSTIDARTKTMIKNYIEKFKYTYNGIYLALKYWYEVKNGDINKSNGSIGIVQYIYDEAMTYYRSLWEIQQQLSEKNAHNYRPEKITIKIPSPKRKIKKKNKFSILEDDE